jgi:hypothetical protein
VLILRFALNETPYILLFSATQDILFLLSFIFPTRCATPRWVSKYGCSVLHQSVPRPIASPQPVALGIPQSPWTRHIRVAAGFGCGGFLVLLRISRRRFHPSGVRWSFSYSDVYRAGHSSPVAHSFNWIESHLRQPISRALRSGSSCSHRFLIAFRTLPRVKGFSHPARAGKL